MSYANRATSSSTGERQPIGKRERSPSGRRRIQTKAPTVGAQGVSRRPSQAPGPNWSGLTCRRSGGKSQMLWRMPVIPALGRLRQEDRCKFKASLGYKVALPSPPPQQHPWPPMIQTIVSNFISHSPVLR
ncbi:PREDICTED: uncharacterized protein LOC106148472 isoform X3 [Chinchilla lanigera]|uniref:uncharacterized protein LOC106148472 isoform X3 n=1 Tax=Chinchilla lanigera TaxID=34839 RepID=UPI000696BA48|nr:PREDICTED: uncharacterized protein LOC106148472 isoform X3 [Chinchilla lanigera]